MFILDINGHYYDDLYWSSVMSGLHHRSDSCYVVGACACLLNIVPRGLTTMCSVIALCMIMHVPTPSAAGPRRS